MDWINMASVNSEEDSKWWKERGREGGERREEVEGNKGREIEITKMCFH